MSNEQFKQEFIRKFVKHLEVTFHPERVVKTIDSLAANIKDEMPRHIDRWKDEADYALQSVEDWQSELDFMKSFALQRPTIVVNIYKCNLSMPSINGNIIAIVGT